MKRPVSLEVFSENIVAQKLYRSCGFKTEKVTYQQWDEQDRLKYSGETRVLI